MEIGMEEEEIDNIVLDEFNREVFNKDQRYVIPINDSKENGSVTCTTMFIPKGTLVKRFHFAFRRWLIMNSIPIVRYCYDANLPEFVCDNIPNKEDIDFNCRWYSDEEAK